MMVIDLKKHWLSATGTILIVIATANFSYRIPKVDADLTDLSDKIMTTQFNIDQMHIAHAVGSLTHNQWKILGELSPDSTKLRELLLDAIQYKKIFLVGAKILAEGDLPRTPTQLTDDGTTLAQLDAEIRKYLTEPKYHKSNVRRKSVLERKKSKILFWSILFQISGLLCLQFDQMRQKQDRLPIG